ncbi:hypothetical protein LCGC14_1717130 [marine sediment metagenome]|uniref:Radical SAM core domain-containing protein n=1 Tax=marine sediment metagenome TaxID=412755 RepID=A0A0F9HD88_9ZZZZ
MNRDLIVSEIFGPTFQGEGSTLGRPAIFLRLGICNLACTWCDTKYTWDWKSYNPKEELHRLTFDDIYQQLWACNGSGARRLVVTGGEPMIQQAKLARFLPIIAQEWNWQLEIETAGTISPHPDLLSKTLHFNVSPKLAHSGNELSLRYKPEVLKRFNTLTECSFKFVVGGIEDFSEIDSIVRECLIDREKIWIMPEGRSPATIARTTELVADEVVLRGWNLTTRLQVLAFGDRRGY